MLPKVLATKDAVVGLHVAMTSPVDVTLSL
jgi:hypothetical protein